MSTAILLAFIPLFTSTHCSSDIAVLTTPKYQIINNKKEKINGIYEIYKKPITDKIIIEGFNHFQPFKQVINYKNTQHHYFLHLIDKHDSIIWLIQRAPTKTNTLCPGSVILKPGWVFRAEINSLHKIPKETAWRNCWNESNLTITVKPFPSLIPPEPPVSTRNSEIRQDAQAQQSNLSAPLLSDSDTESETSSQKEVFSSYPRLILPFDTNSHPGSLHEAHSSAHGSPTLTDTDGIYDGVQAAIGTAAIYDDNVLLEISAIATNHNDKIEDKIEDKMVQLIGVVLLFSILCVIFIGLAACRRSGKKKVYQSQQMHASIKAKPVLDNCYKRSMAISKQANTIKVDLSVAEGEKTIVREWKPEKFGDVLLNVNGANEMIMDDIVNEMETDEGLKWEMFEQNVAVDLDDDYEIDGDLEFTITALDND